MTEGVADVAQRVYDRDGTLQRRIAMRVVRQVLSVDEAFEYEHERDARQRLPDMDQEGVVLSVAADSVVVASTASLDEPVPITPQYDRSFSTDIGGEAKARERGHGGEQPAYHVAEGGRARQVRAPRRGFAAHPDTMGVIWRTSIILLLLLL